MKILIISGTPKTDGITHSLVVTARETAASIGCEAEVISLSASTLHGCKMCGDGWGVCFKEHQCKYENEDDFGALHVKMSGADAFVYITPVYWGEVSEAMKCFLDRLRRCEATKQWNERPVGESFHKGKPSILVANAGGGGGGILTALADMERAIGQMHGDSWPRETAGIFDYIAVNRWNQAYKREALSEAVKAMVQQHEAKH
jgi:multimeric flavodoxin WrbA